jgi:lycopene beta-cyclase
MKRQDAGLGAGPRKGAAQQGDSQRDYDFIIVGGGVSGLSLALELARSPLREHSILMIEPQAKDRNDRTLCFWTEQASAYDEIVFHSWDRLRFAGDGFEQVLDLGKYRYNMLRGIDFYRYAQERLAAYENVEFVRGRVDRIEAAGLSPGVWASGRPYTGKWVFDSRFRIANLRRGPEDYRLLRQHFKGWVIETPDARFDPDTVTFLDFRTPQKDEPRFFYVLPFSETQALVECVFLSHDDYDRVLSDYIRSVLRTQNYTILSREGGVNPLTDFPFARRLGPRVMAIGTAGGRVKPTSGYAFTRIQKDSAAIVQSLVENGDPFGVPADPAFFRFCDAMMLKIMDEHGDRVESIFARMFRANSVERIFHFLDETSTPVENLGLISSLAQPLFIKVLFEVLVSRKMGAWQIGRKLDGSTRPVSAPK